MRRILHHGSDPLGTPVLLSDRAIAGCWFELHRQGGCGAGEVALRDAFEDRHEIEVGDWISFETEPGERWYLGRVEERTASVPGRVRLRLEGMGVELNEVFPGGFGVDADGRRPHRLAATDLFPNDPDHTEESVDIVGTVDAVVHTLIEDYVAVATHIVYDPLAIEPAIPAVPVTSLKFRGEESVRAVLKDLAMRARSASWGVDAAGTFFFRNRTSEIGLTLRAGRDLTSLDESRDREFLFNRVLLTGDYVYDVRELSGAIARRSFRWRANFTQPASKSAYGERRLRLWIPWIRTQADSMGFIREFFRTYSQPTSRYRVETIPQAAVLWPWQSCIRLEDRDGAELIVAQPETIRVLFDHAPRFRLELGPIDPRELWPEPPQDERWELREDQQPGGGDLSLTGHTDDPPESSDDGGSDSAGGSSPLDSLTSAVTSDMTSDITSSLDSEATSSLTSDLSSAVTSTAGSSGGVSSGGASSESTAVSTLSTGGLSSNDGASSSGIPPGSTDSTYGSSAGPMSSYSSYSSSTSGNGT